VVEVVEVDATILRLVGPAPPVAARLDLMRPATLLEEVSQRLDPEVVVEALYRATMHQIMLVEVVEAIMAVVPVLTRRAVIIEVELAVVDLSRVQGR
jgi:hypothetical protein|tara:strand:+ start:180 stop:470 length:291 start_codon:yes stop_codon:yes gene_type:complete